LVSVYYGLKDQNNLAQPSGLGKETVLISLALKGQNKNRGLCCSFGAFKKNNKHQNPRALPWAMLYCTFGAAFKY
jgi:hypothetical protein